MAMSQELLAMVATSLTAITTTMAVALITFTKAILFLWKKAPTLNGSKGLTQGLEWVFAHVDVLVKESPLLQWAVVSGVGPLREPQLCL